jgi:hypothetical protein
MARIRAIVSSVRDGQVSEKYPAPSKWISLEGISVLPGRNCREIPEAGMEIEAVVSVRWPSEAGKKPMHFLESWVPAV